MTKPLEDYPHVQVDRCNCCGEDVIWVRGASGIAIPVNREPVPDGEVIIIMGEVQPPLNELLEAILGPDVRYKQHVMTCPELRTEEGQRRRLEKAMSKPAHNHKIERCNCGADFFFAPSAKGNGKNIPVCQHPDPTGNLFLNDKGEAVYVSGQNPAPPGAQLYKSHFADCPHAAQHRTKK